MKSNHLAIGILAHVDAGKTTLAEGILYHCKSIRKLGRVDHKDAFLDTYALEKARGITIFSKQARVTLGNTAITLLDTPGHVDFSAEMERTLQVLDYAILVISGTDGVQGHVLTLWKLLKRYQIPVFLFVNKMDQPGNDKKRLLEELKKRLDERCVAFEDEISDTFLENVAVCDDVLLERYLEGGAVSREDIVALIQKRKIFPCYFGSALKLTGVDIFLEGIRQYTASPEYSEAFGARVFKIGRDNQGKRLTYLKVTGGSLKVKQVLTNKQVNGSTLGELWEQKVDQIRLYSGNQHQPVQEAGAGTICAVTGLEYTRAGQGLGIESGQEKPLLEPVLTYKLLLPPECDVYQTYAKLAVLEEEDPQLHLVWQEESGEIHVQVMGQVQMEILQSLVKERFDIAISFGEGSIVYKETIGTTVEGVGHFEPLRHYAEVHLLLEPGERGSGLVFGSVCSEDVLDKNWQRLIMTHLEEKVHKGVLTGSELTDVRITLLTGRAHQKHTEGGDFRQATYRAIRQGLMEAKCVLLEPVYEFSLEVPLDAIGRAMNDLQKMQASFSQPQQEGTTAIITGSAPVSQMRGYQKEVVAYTRGEGRLFCGLKGYEPCHNSEEITAKIGYDPEHDLANPTGSVFCSHGAGFPVAWNEVKQYMHLESLWAKEQAKKEKQREQVVGYASMTGGASAGKAPSSEAGTGSKKREKKQDVFAEDKELEEIFIRTYGPIKERRNAFSTSVRKQAVVSEETQKATEYLLVDGYNVIFAWEELNELAKTDLTAARQRLMDILSNYQGYRGNVLILVFDAYKVEGYQGEVQKYHNIYVVYTKEAETADQYIEKAVMTIDKRHRITVATSDGIEQVIIMGQGALRMSAAGLKDEVIAAQKQMREVYSQGVIGAKNYLFQNLSEEMTTLMEDVRLGKKAFGEAEEKTNKTSKKK